MNPGNDLHGSSGFMRAHVHVFTETHASRYRGGHEIFSLLFVFLLIRPSCFSAWNVQKILFPLFTPKREVFHELVQNTLPKI